MYSLLLLLASVSSANTHPRRDFPLFDGSLVAVTEASRVVCTQHSQGFVCGASSTPISGIWPRGTDHNYLFLSGLQIAGIVAGTDAPGFAWPGDTVGAFFLDMRGTQRMGAAITGIYDWYNDDHRRFWPAYVSAPDLFHAGLLGRPVVSDQDTWTRYWDLSSQTDGRPHPAGLLVEQRTLSFNDYGLEDVLFLVYRLTNVSARDPAAYSNLSQAGYRSAEIAKIARLGGRFQDQVENEFAVQVPDGGYAIDSVYVGFAQDPDVFDFSANYVSANLVFRSGFAYEGRFDPGQHVFPPEIFSPPFAAAPGLVMTGWVRTPRIGAGVEAPLAAWSHVSSLPLRDPIGVAQLWRYLSLNLSTAAGDNSCSIADAKARRLCAPPQTWRDARHFSSAGPMSLPPGQSATFIIAQVYAAPVQAPLAAAGWTGGIGFDLQPGIPVDGQRLVQGLDTVRTIDRVAGWLSYADADGDGEVEMNEVSTVPRSLFAKFQRAAAVASNGFLAGMAPEAPAFHVLPGDGHATVVWQRSATETTGDPFFALTSDPVSGAYDPNFRRFDVEGYRVWRGTSPTTMQPIATFDYAGTTMVDSTGTFHYGSFCAPELGVTSGCPVLPRLHGLTHTVIQVAPGNRVLLGNGAVGLLRADTAGPSGQNPFFGLEDTGVPFAIVDSSLQNGREYYYAVTAFDVNSAASGTVTKESVPSGRPVRPRVSSSSLSAGGVGPLQLVREDGDTTTIPMPTLDSVTGQFSGPMPPASVNLDFLAFVPEIVDSGAIALRIDSIVPTLWVNENGTFGNYHLTLFDSGGSRPLVLPVTVEFHDFENEYRSRFPAAPASASRLARYGRSDSGFALFGEFSFRIPGTYRLTSWSRGSLNASPFSSEFNGPRWWSGAANETVTDPQGSHCFPASAGCISTLNRTAGGLTGVTTLFHVLSYGTVPSQPMRQIEALTSLFTRAADFRITWGAAGAINEVFDETHGISVPFSPVLRAGWGILNQASFAGTDQALTADLNNLMLTWSDLACVAPLPAMVNVCGGAAQTSAVLQNSATLSLMAATSSSFAGTSGLPATGNGFIFYLNGHFFLMQMAALPTAGTVWHARFYSGSITGSAATGTFHFMPAERPPAAPGLTFRRSYRGTQSVAVASGRSLLERVHTVPDPYYAAHSLETGGSQNLRFVNLPSQAIVRIYSASGILVTMLNHNDAQDGGELTWDLRSRNGRRVASGVYFFHVESADGSATGRFTIVNR